MANVRLALEQVTYEIDSLDELIQLAQSGALDGLYLEIDYDGREGDDRLFLAGKPTHWSVNISGRYITYQLFARLFTKLSGMPVYLT